MKIQIDLPEDLSKKVKIYKIKNSLATQKEAIINILNKYFKEKEE